MNENKIASQELDIATAPRRTAKHWKNSKITWADLLKRLEKPTRTGETAAEYAAMKKSERDARKDQGGFVGGLLKDGIRKKGQVLRRQIVTLDADNIPHGTDFPALCQQKFSAYAYAIYTTHSHTPQKARYRLLLPLSRPVTEDEYEPVARFLAHEVGMDFFDPTTYEASRLMYWPSASRDGDYQYIGQPGAFYSPDDVEARLEDWKDASRWPVAKTETVARQRTLKKLGDPREKPGLIGAFCRAYTIEAAIAKFIPDAYTKVEGMKDRYTYNGGSTTGGMIVYDDGLHAYSHHATDPISGMDVNAFDLVRLHLFGLKDDDVDEDVPINKRPSYVAMTTLCQNDDKVKEQQNAELKRALQESFTDEVEAFVRENGGGEVKEGKEKKSNADWVDKIKRLKNGRILSNAFNFLLILKHDPRLKGATGFDEFSGRIVVRRNLPWRKHVENGFDVWTDADDAQLRNFISLSYEGLQGKQLLDDAFTEVTMRNSFHPVLDWFKTLVWDGKRRLGRLLIDYLGAEDSPYVEEVTEKFFKAAVARVKHPGLKFDQCLVLTGPQGIGKSTVLARMGGKWYQDTMPTIKGKDAMEALQGFLIVELSEMQAATRAENDEFKAFISRQSDKFRAPYGRRTEEHPRQCVFAATTNERIFLKDRTGGRRFWTIDCKGSEHNAFLEFTQHEVEQCWAEAIALYQKDKSLYPTRATEEKLKELVEAHTEGAEKVGLIQAYLDMLLPEQWDSMGIEERRQYCDGTMEIPPMGVNQRERVCTMEIWCECFGNSPRNLRNMDARELNTIMGRMPGWKPYDKNRGRLRFSHYGVQRAYIRDGHFQSDKGVGDSVGGKKSPTESDLNELF